MTERKQTNKNNRHKGPSCQGREQALGKCPWEAGGTGEVEGGGGGQEMADQATLSAA